LNYLSCSNKIRVGDQYQNGEDARAHRADDHANDRRRGDRVANASTAEAALRDIPEAAHAIGLQIQVLNASTTQQIEAAFATLLRDRAEALLVAPDAFFVSRRVQFATLATRHGIPAAYVSREAVEVGGLMSYGTDRVEMFRQVGTYTGQVLKGAKPADLPVLQSTKFEFVINLQTARVLGIEVPSALQSLADERSSLSHCRPDFSPKITRQALARTSGPLGKSQMPIKLCRSQRPYRAY
jgi:hypothetical protein